MGIQDDIFDVESALEGKPEENSFERIYQYLARLERDIEALRVYENAFGALGSFMDLVDEQRKKRK